MQSVSTQSTLPCFACMLNDGIHADVTIKIVDGTLRAHKAFLSTSSPIFIACSITTLKKRHYP
ncbi:hypothetical protein CRYUN_Cryun30bG0071500 [Craigia yunnanensis]